MRLAGLSARWMREVDGGGELYGVVYVCCN